MTLTLLISEGCPTCDKVEHKLRSFTQKKQNINLKVADIENHPGSKSPVVPALFVDDLLYSYGDFDIDKLEKLILKKSNGS